MGLLVKALQCGDLKMIGMGKHVVRLSVFWKSMHAFVLTHPSQQRMR